jgi:hypothetical protein
MTLVRLLGEYTFCSGLQPSLFDQK